MVWFGMVVLCDVTCCSVKYFEVLLCLVSHSAVK